MEISSEAVEPLWKAAFGDVERPQLYKITSAGSDEFLPLNDPQTYIQELHGMSRAKLYALASNGQLAMKLAQDEYLSLEKLVRSVKDKEPAVDPQALEDPDVFEEEKQAALYGYKYVPAKPALLGSNLTVEGAEPTLITDAEKKEVRLPTDPFMQGGFYPTNWKSSDYQKMKAKAANPNNIDGWQPVLKDGKKLVPRANPRKSYWLEEVDWITRKQKEGQKKVDAMKAMEAGYELRPGSSSSNNSQNTPSRVVNKPLTRFKGRKHPPTRDVSEAPSTASTPRGRSQNTPQFISIPGTPAGLGSPNNKRRRLNPTPKSRTRAAAVEDAAAAPITMSREELFDKRWDANELIACIAQNHAWLNKDPAKALQWKNKITTSKFPVRTFSMFKKWAFWKENGQAKRPRRGKSDKKGSTSVPAMPETETEEDEAFQGGDQGDGEYSEKSQSRSLKRKATAEDETEKDKAGRAVKEDLKLQIPGKEANGSADTSSSPNTPTRRSARNARRASG